MVPINFSSMSAQHYRSSVYGVYIRYCIATLCIERETVGCVQFNRATAVVAVYLTVITAAVCLVSDLCFLLTQLSGAAACLRY